MTAAAEALAARIRQTGPMTVAEFMAECLMNPVWGYYATRDPLGAQGDFTTAPEISQMFGELLGLALAQVWLDRGSPASVRLVELGPGRGTLMADLLRATRIVPGFHDALTLHLVETSPALRARQSETVTHPFTHHAALEDVPDGPLYLIANEFFDALPIRQFLREGSVWRERVVGLEDGRLVFGLAGPTEPSDLAPRLADTHHGDLVEQNPTATAIAAEIGARIARYGGVALIVDYGDWHSLGDTLQALRGHRAVPPLETPGEADLTAHVDFEALARAASRAKATPLTPQGTFLESLGIAARAEALAKNLSGPALASHKAAFHRLTSPDEMGTLFKVMALYQPNTPLPPGFSA